VIQGQNLIRDEQRANYLYIFEIKTTTDIDQDKFDVDQVYRRELIEKPIFRQISMQFYFKNVDIGSEKNALIFCKID